MANSPLTSPPDSPRRMLLWRLSPKSAPSRLCGTPSIASVRAETPVSLPLMPKSLVFGHPSPVMSRPDPDMEGGNWSYQNMDFGNEHLAALTPAALTNLRSETVPTWTIDIPGWDRRVRRKDSWNDEPFVPLVENGQAGAPPSYQTGVETVDVDAGENHGGPTVHPGDTPVHPDNEVGALRARSPGPDMTDSGVGLVPAPENPQIGPWLPQTSPHHEHMTAHEAEAGTGQSIPILSHAGLPEPAMSLTDEIIELYVPSPRRIHDSASSNISALTMHSPLVHDLGDPFVDQPTSLLRATAPSFSPADLEIWPNSTGSFSHTPAVAEGTIVIFPTSPIASHISTARNIPIAPGSSSTIIGPVADTSEDGFQQMDKPLTAEVFGPDGQPGSNLQKRQKFLELQKVVAPRLQSASDCSMGENEMKDIQSSNDLAVDPSSPSLTSCQSTAPEPIPEHHRDNLGHGELMSHGEGISPSRRPTNDFARTPPVAPRAMLQRYNNAQEPVASGSWSSSKTWVSGDARMRYQSPHEFALKQEEARRQSDLVGQQLQEKDAMIEDLHRDIRMKEEDNADSKEEEPLRAPEPPQQMEEPAVVADPQAEEPALLSPRRDSIPEDLQHQFNKQWPSLSGGKAKSDHRVRQGLPNGRLPRAGSEEDTLLAPPNPEPIALDDGGFLRRRRASNTGVQSDQDPAAAHEDVLPEEEIDSDQPQQSE